MMRKVVTYSGKVKRFGTPVTAIVTARTKKLAAELLSIPMSEFRYAWTPTKDKLQLEVAVENQVFFTDKEAPDSIASYKKHPRRSSYYTEKELQKINIVTLLLEADAIRNDISFFNAAEGQAYRQEAGGRSRAKYYWGKVSEELTRRNVVPNDGDYLL